MHTGQGAAKQSTPQDTQDTPAEGMRRMPPMADQIVDKAIDNMTRKLVAGYRNKKNAVPNAKRTDHLAETKETLAAVSA